MKGRTYRYFNDPLFAFGYGKSYTEFKIGDADFSSKILEKGGDIKLTIPVENIGKRNGTEIVQVYIRNKADQDGPLKTLRGFQRVGVKAGGKEYAIITLDGKSFEGFDASTNTIRTMNGKYEVYYGNSSRNEDLKKVEVDVKGY